MITHAQPLMVERNGQPLDLIDRIRTSLNAALRGKKGSGRASLGYESRSSNRSRRTRHSARADSGPSVKPLGCAESKRDRVQEPAGTASNFRNFKAQTR